MIEEFDFIIRNSGERTTDLSFKYHQKLFPRARLFLTGVPENPQWQNLFLFIKELKRLTGPVLVIDSDIFLTRPSIVPELLERAETTHHHLKSKVICKFMNSVYRGAYFFSSKIIEEMSAVLFDTNFDLTNRDFVIRPLRSIVVRSMTNLGLDSNNDSDDRNLGIHDFGQYRKHIFHKFIYRGWREGSAMSKNIESKLIENSDLDYIAALEGLKYSSSTTPSHLGHRDVSSVFNDLGIEEKQSVISKIE
jgi:hypothetical protein